MGLPSYCRNLAPSLVLICVVQSDNAGTVVGIISGVTSAVKKSDLVAFVLVIHSTSLVFWTLDDHWLEWSVESCWYLPQVWYSL